MLHHSVHHAASNLGVLDLFVAGAGFDIAGAWLLARGLTTSSEKAAWLMIHSRNSFARFDVRSAEDYADGQIGRGSLIVGFFIQTVAYVLLAHGAKPLSHSYEALVGLVGSGAAAILFVFAVAHKARPWLRDRWLVNLARIDNFGWPHALPSGKELFTLGQLVGKPAYGREYGDNEAYALRVFKTRVRDDTKDNEVRPSNYQPVVPLDDSRGYFSELSKAHWRLRGFRLVRERPDPPDPPPETEA
jgi:hypothetical protein